MKIHGAYTGLLCRPVLLQNRGMDRRRRLKWWYVLTVVGLPILAAGDVTVALAWAHPMAPMLFGGLVLVGLDVSVLFKVRQALEQERAADASV